MPRIFMRAWLYTKDEKEVEKEISRFEMPVDCNTEEVAKAAFEPFGYLMSGINHMLRNLTKLSMRVAKNK